jgi:hypothetical protein
VKNLAQLTGISIFTFSASDLGIRDLWGQLVYSLFLFVPEPPKPLPSDGLAAALLEGSGSLSGYERGYPPSRPLPPTPDDDSRGMRVRASLQNSPEE